MNIIFSKKGLLLVMYVFCFVQLIHSATIINFTTEENTTEIVEVDEDAWTSKDETGTRSAQSSIFTCIKYNNELIIHNTNPVFDLTISILSNRTGELLYNVEIDKNYSNHIILPLSGLMKGEEYRLLISNKTAGYATATFEL